MVDFKALGKEKAESKKNSPMCTLPCGLFVVLGETTYEHDEVKYQGKFGLKFGKAKTDWVRMSYTDAAALYKFMTEQKAFINEMIKNEQEELTGLML